MTAGPDLVRVVTWNIQFGINVGPAAELLGTHPDLQDADVLLLQEMDEAGVDEIGRALEMSYVYASSGVHAMTGRHFGNAVLSAHPIEDHRAVALPHRSGLRGQHRVVSRCRVIVNGFAIETGSVHTEVPSLGRAKRREQFERTAAAFAAAPDRPAILGGDFNTATQRGAEMVRAALATAGLTRMSSGPTLRRSGRDFELDHVYARGFGDPDVAIVRGHEASDHWPLRVDLRPLDPVV